MVRLVLTTACFVLTGCLAVPPSNQYPHAEDMRPPLTDGDTLSDQSDSGRGTCEDTISRCRTTCTWMTTCIDNRSICTRFTDSSATTAFLDACIQSCSLRQSFRRFSCAAGACEGISEFLREEIPEFPGLCGADSDGDGVFDDEDNCPTLPNPEQIDSNSDGTGDVCAPEVDFDVDGIQNEADNCPWTVNPDQLDNDEDGIGDACSADRPDQDLDLISDSEDNCPLTANFAQSDRDNDGVGDLCDNCPDHANVLQEDADEDGVGDACIGSDRDNDGVSDALDVCVQLANPEQTDSDGDGLGDVCDNCPEVPNPSQFDADDDGRGEACDPLLAPMYLKLEWGLEDTNFDLHLLNAYGVFFEESNSCGTNNPQPGWCNPGYMNNAPFEPPVAQEQVRFARFVRDEIFTLGVDLLPHASRSVSQASVRLKIYCSGELRHTVGPVTLRTERSGVRQFWDVGYVTNDCAFMPTREIRTVTCDEDEAACRCPECMSGICRGSACGSNGDCNRRTGECQAIPEVCDDRDNDADGVIDEGICRCQAIMGTRFTICNTNVERSIAASVCRRRGDVLASHLIADDLAALRSQLRAANGLWVGLNDALNEGTFVWEDGEPMTAEESALWQTMQPDDFNDMEDCVELLRDGLNDQDCTRPRRFLCSAQEMNDPPPVDAGLIDSDAGMAGSDAGTD